MRRPLRRPIVMAEGATPRNAPKNRRGETLQTPDDAVAALNGHRYMSCVSDRNGSARYGRSRDKAMRDYAVICSCGYRTSRRTLGQAALDRTRHLAENPRGNHSV